jgi:hypothetical protein
LVSSQCDPKEEEKETKTKISLTNPQSLKFPQVILCVLLYDLLLAPAFARRGRPITPLQRIGGGFVFAILSMLAAGTVETIRLEVVADNNLQDVDPNSDPGQVVPSEFGRLLGRSIGT